MSARTRLTTAKPRLRALEEISQAEETSQRMAKQNSRLQLKPCSLRALLLLMCLSSLLTYFPLLQRTYTPLEQLPRTIWITSAAHNLTMAGPIANSWVRLNPEFQVVHHNDQEADAFVCSMYDTELCQIYQSLPLPVMKADFWRYAVLYAKGGVYADANAECLTPIREWKVDGFCGFWAGQESNKFLGQWTLASLPHHPALEQVIELMRTRARSCTDSNLTMRDCLLKYSVHYLTGPSAFTDGIEEVFLWVPSTGIRRFDEWTRTWRLMAASWLTRSVCIRTQSQIRYSPREGYYHGFVHNRLDLGVDSERGWRKQVNALRKGRPLDNLFD
jgi:mannosyltransferase OCH1-like enzyme